MSRQERQLDAAEYVIGTMTSAERLAFEASIESDAETREDVAFWERAFGALNATVPPQIPSDEVWEAIRRHLDEAAAGSAAVTQAAPEKASSGRQSTTARPPEAANDNLIAKLRRSRSRWRFGAVAAAVAAFALGLWAAGQGFGVPPTDHLAEGDDRQYVAVVNATGDQPSLIVTIDADTGKVTVRSLGIERPQGKSLELWYVPQGQSPVSVGLVSEGEIDVSDVDVANGDLLAISLEPEGGSPTGTATGPIVYTGKLVENVNAD